MINSIDISDNVNIITRYNFADTCTKSELNELLNYLNNIKRLVSRYNMSPFEICIFVYDLLRERPYKESPKISIKDVDKDKIANMIENQSNSRSIIKVFKSDEIVCAGFANLYSAILDLFGIYSDPIIYT